MNRILIVLLVPFIWFSNSSASGLREWTNKDGKKIEAEFITIENDEIIFEKSTGDRFRYPVINLSLDSQAEAKRLVELGIFAHIPPRLRLRCSPEHREDALKKHGADERVPDAIEQGLEWIASQQDATGTFGGKYTVGTTGLCLLSYLGNGESTYSEKYGTTVINAGLYLMDRALKNEGLIHYGENGHHISYEHGIATLALAELYSLSKESDAQIPRLDSLLTKAAEIIVKGQTKNGGWAYGYKTSAADDTSLTGWQVQALVAAKESGVEIENYDSVMASAMSCLKEAQDLKGAFRYRLEHATGKPTLTGESLYSLFLGKEKTSPEFKKGITFLTGAYANPSPGTTFYAPQFNTQIFFVNGGRGWEKTRDKLIPALLDQQTPEGTWGTNSDSQMDSELLSTAWAIQMLQVFYRYDQ